MKLKKINDNFKKSVNIKQDNNHIIINGSVSDHTYKIKDLCFTNEESKISFSVPNQKNKGDFYYDINIKKEFNEVVQKEGVFRLDIIVQIYKKNITKNRIKKIKSKKSFLNETEDFLEYYIRLGRFEETVTDKLNPTIINGNSFTLYKTIKGNLSLAVNKSINQKFTTNIESIISKKNTIKFSGKLLTKTYKIKTIELIVSGREYNRQVSFPVSIKHLNSETKKQYGLNVYEYKTDILLKEMFKNVKKDSDIYEVFLKVYSFNKKEPTLVKVGKPNQKVKDKARMVHTTIGDKVFTANIYYTYKMASLCFQVEDFKKENYKYLKRLMRWSFLLRPFYKKKDIWIIGEHKYRAQDTGLHFFKHVRTKHPKKNAYYIISEDSPHTQNVNPYGNVLYYKSKDHIKATLFANKIVASHDPHFFYPLRTEKFKRKLHAKIIFIQHGVLGVKNLTALYSKDAGRIEADLMIVSSDKERDITLRDFGYKKDQVAVTGLSRFDSLFKNDIPTKRQLLIIPTWREWLLQKHVFLESEYLKRYLNLIYDQRLHQLSEKYNFEVVLCLHPNMQHFTEVFNNAPCRVVSQEEVSVQDLLKESIMMITDYSSVAFDFSFLEKPIIYYQFDRKRFLGKAGSHLNLDEDLPGDIVFETTQIFNLIDYYARNNFKMKKENKQKESKFIKYKDQYSSERIYNQVNELKIESSFLRGIKQFKKIIKLIYNKFIRN